MKVHYRAAERHWHGPLLCVTHSARAVELERCSRSELAQRYADPQRLPARVAFEELTPSYQHSPWKGQVSVWAFDGGDWCRPRLLAQLEPDWFKPQHAVWHRGRLWIFGCEVLESYDAALNLRADLEDPWMAGGHTIAPDGQGRLLLSCSASDAVLVVDEASLEVVTALRMPEAIYGHNYPLTRTDSVVDHYVANDLQLTHLNCAWPYAGGVLVSTLIQGALGWFDAQGNYQEFARGFVGCHGARASRAGALYFSDSAGGSVVFLDGTYQVQRQVDLDSRWLHDALELDGSIWALALADRNQVLIYDMKKDRLIHAMDCASFGESTQFLSFGNS